jgi:uncharacterized protein YrrD
MDIPVDVEVHCTDGLCGRSTYVLINPVRKEVTHLVVKEAEWPHAERVVPIDAVSETAPDVILLHGSRDQVHKMAPFAETEYIEEDMPTGERPVAGYMGTGSYMLWPYTTPYESELVPVEHKKIPLGEVAIKRGTGVEATDGRVGRVDELLVTPENDHFTHLVMREGHLWGQKDIAIPVSEIDRMEEDTVYLKLNKKEIAALPAIPVRRWGS